MEPIISDEDVTLDASTSSSSSSSSSSSAWNTEAFTSLLHSDMISFTFSWDPLLQALKSLSGRLLQQQQKTAALESQHREALEDVRHRMAELETQANKDALDSLQQRLDQMDQKLADLQRKQSQDEADVGRMGDEEKRRLQELKDWVLEEMKREIASAIGPIQVKVASSLEEMPKQPSVPAPEGDPLIATASLATSTKDPGTDSPISASTSSGNNSRRPSGSISRPGSNSRLLPEITAAVRPLPPHDSFEDAPSTAPFLKRTSSILGGTLGKYQESIDAELHKMRTAQEALAQQLSGQNELIDQLKATLAELSNGPPAAGTSDLTKDLVQSILQENLVPVKETQGKQDELVKNLKLVADRNTTDIKRVDGLVDTLQNQMIMLSMKEPAAPNDGADSNKSNDNNSAGASSSEQRTPRGLDLSLVFTKISDLRKTTDEAFERLNDQMQRLENQSSGRQHQLDDVWKVALANQNKQLVGLENQLNAYKQLLQRNQLIQDQTKPQVAEWKKMVEQCEERILEATSAIWNRPVVISSSEGSVVTPRSALQAAASISTGTSNRSIFSPRASGATTDASSGNTSATNGTSGGASSGTGTPRVTGSGNGTPRDAGGLDGSDSGGSMLGSTAGSNAAGELDSLNELQMLSRAVRRTLFMLEPLMHMPWYLNDALQRLQEQLNVLKESFNQLKESLPGNLADSTEASGLGAQLEDFLKRFKYVFDELQETKRVNSVTEKRNDPLIKSLELMRDKLENLWSLWHQNHAQGGLRQLRKEVGALSTGPSNASGNGNDYARETQSRLNDINRRLRVLEVDMGVNGGNGSTRASSSRDSSQDEQIQEEISKLREELLNEISPLTSALQRLRQEFADHVESMKNGLFMKRGGGDAMKDSLDSQAELVNELHHQMRIKETHGENADTGPGREFYRATYDGLLRDVTKKVMDDVLKSVQQFLQRHAESQKNGSGGNSAFTAIQHRQMLDSFADRMDARIRESRDATAQEFGQLKRDLADQLRLRIEHALRDLRAELMIYPMPMGDETTAIGTKPVMCIACSRPVAVSPFTIRELTGDFADEAAQMVPRLEEEEAVSGVEDPDYVFRAGFKMPVNDKSRVTLPYLAAQATRAVKQTKYEKTKPRRPHRDRVETVVREAEELDKSLRQRMAQDYMGPPPAQ